MVASASATSSWSARSFTETEETDLKVSSKASDVKDSNLAAQGQDLVDWAAREMPVLTLIRQRFVKDQPLKGLRLAACLHVTSETANLMLTLKSGGADIALCASNPLSTNDAVAASLAMNHGIKTYAIRGEDNDTYYGHIEAALDHRPQLTMDDGADLVSVLHKSRREQLAEVIGGTEETMDGFRVMKMDEAAPEGDIFVTVTGDVNVLDRKHFEAMKDGAILANSGHFNSEINLKALDEIATGVRQVRPSVQEYRHGDGRRLYLLAEGRLINLAAAEGHPAAVMDMSFANQALCAEYIAKNASTLEPKVYDVPADIDAEVARLKLHAMGIKIDTLTEEQQRYLSSWEEGT